MSPSISYLTLSNPIYTLSIPYLSFGDVFLDFLFTLSIPYLYPIYTYALFSQFFITLSNPIYPYLYPI